jgi:hypothetical protein
VYNSTLTYPPETWTERFGPGTGIHRLPPDATEKLSVWPSQVSPAYILTLAILSSASGAGAAAAMATKKMLIAETLKKCMLVLLYWSPFGFGSGVFGLADKLFL